MNRRFFFKALGALTASATVSPAIAKRLSATAPRWKRFVEMRLDLYGAPWMVAYRVGSIQNGGTEWEWATLTPSEPDDRFLEYTDRVALLAFQRKGVL